MKNGARAAALPAASALLCALIVIACPARRQPGAEPEEPVPMVAPQDGEDFSLYFPGGTGRLYAETRRIERPETPEALVETLLTELLQGPASDALEPALPDGVRFAGVHLTESVAFVDLASESGSPPPTGSLQELLSVYSVVNTVLLNVPELESVVLLWNGQQRESFAGHVDTTHPLTSDPDLVANLP